MGDDGDWYYVNKKSQLTQHRTSDVSLRSKCFSFNI